MPASKGGKPVAALIRLSPFFAGTVPHPSRTFQTKRGPPKEGAVMLTKSNLQQGSRALGLGGVRETHGVFGRVTGVPSPGRRIPALARLQGTQPISIGYRCFMWG